MSHTVKGVLGFAILRCVAIWVIYGVYLHAGPYSKDFTDFACIEVSVLCGYHAQRHACVHACMRACMRVGNFKYADIPQYNINIIGSRKSYGTVYIIG